MGLGLGLGLGFELELRLRREAGVEKNIFMIVSRVVDLLRKNDHVVKVGSGPVDLLVDAVGLLFLISSTALNIYYGCFNQNEIRILAAFYRCTFAFLFLSFLHYSCSCSLR